MDDMTIMLAVKAHLEAACELVDHELDKALPLPDEQQEMLAITVLAAQALNRRAYRDALRWLRAFRAGDDAWLVMHCAGGKVTGTYHSSLPREARAFLGR